MVDLSDGAVTIRFWCKFSLKSGIRAEDWWIFAAVPIYLGAVADDIWGVYSGISGEDSKQVIATLLQTPSPELILALENYLKSLYIGFILNLFLLTFVRISICLLYKRIFATPRFRIKSLIMIGLSVAWFISAFVVGLVYCVPLDKFWHPFKPGRCLNFNLFYLLIGVFETLIDIAILILPVRATFTVQLPLKTKLLVSSIFLLGGVAVITNVLRLYKIYRPGEQYLSFTETIFWTHIHGLIAVLCANLPVYKPLRTKVPNIFSVLQRSFGSSFRSSRGDTTQRIGDSVECLEPNFHLKPILSDPSMSSHKRPDNYLEEGKYSIFNNPGGTNLSMADRGDGSMDPVTVPPHGIIRTRDVDVF
ncbi:hypothetical protein E0Z10_g10337 [Xylaria hypoxylon]|uniref:Rhodopsin domain-containing protein n=1 Tax=Xylaria hypoxylon TaxID=37992 RepID=A0A4Z0Y6D7_9PEZI|nr:hypothetical protein E0Z10_g10337 [Xylaria hypoxylon]